MDKRPLIRLMEKGFNIASPYPELCSIHVVKMHSMVCGRVKCVNCIANGLENTEEIVQWIKDL